MRPLHEDDSIRNLYAAAYSGSVSTLNALIQQDRLILYRISQSGCTETPLHISALLGHLDFTKALLTHKIQLAQELDSCQRIPLHLASAEGHKETVQVLLEAYDDACLKTDQDGRIPLHYAAMRGRTEVVRKLTGAKPESLRVLDRGKTALHLCVAYNHLETLKAFVEEHVDRISEFLNFKDSDGNNTILHLAVMLKQVETIRYLLSIGIIREEANKNKNGIGLTAIEIVENSPRDFKSLEIQLIFMNAGTESEETNRARTWAPTPTRTRPKRYRWNKFLKCIKNVLYSKGDWLEETRQTLSLVATVIATMTFQVAMNPPGGVVQLGSQSIDLNVAIPSSTYDEYIRNYYRINSAQSPSQAPSSPHRQQDIYPCFYVSNKEIGMVCPGQAVLGFTNPLMYLIFDVFNTIAFAASLSVTMLLISGIPLKHRFSMWFLSIGMCITLTFLALTYLFGTFLVTPPCVFSGFDSVISLCYLTWYGLLLLIAVFITARFLVWIVKLCKHMCMPRKRRAPPFN